MKRIVLVVLLFLISEQVVAVDFDETKNLAEQGDPWYQEPVNPPEIPPWEVQFQHKSANDQNECAPVRGFA